MNGHTPGPWEVVGARTVRGPHPKGGGRTRAVAGCPVAPGTHLREAEANAQLIALAPSLLAAIQDLLFSTWLDDESGQEEVFKRASALLAQLEEEPS